MDNSKRAKFIVHYHSYSPSFAKFLKITRSPYFFILIIAFCSFSYFYLDKHIAVLVKHNLHGSIIYIGEILTLLGRADAYLIVLPLLLILCKFILKNREWTWKCAFLLAAIIVPSLVCLIIKFILGRARPTLLFSDDLYGFTFFHIKAAYLSFPSGHSVLITGLMMGLASLFSRFWIGFMVIILLVSFSRIVVGAHYLSDVIAGMYLSILIVPWLQDKLAWRYQRQNSIADS